MVGSICSSICNKRIYIYQWRIYTNKVAVWLDWDGVNLPRRAESQIANCVPRTAYLNFKQENKYKQQVISIISQVVMIRITCGVILSMP